MTAERFELRECLPVLTETEQQEQAAKVVAIKKAERNLGLRKTAP